MRRHYSDTRRRDSATASAAAAAAAERSRVAGTPADPRRSGVVDHVVTAAPPSAHRRPTDRASAPTRARLRRHAAPPRARAAAR